ncbi:MAG: glutamine--fructose-6-phosphate aminotransferase [Nitrospirae bacterium GWB2_47_37]|nr:MAG: glutamine--fructose-6-phosphate aminotransferase [Nitrospirae bacterium GWA2_46_11]OGW26094.1 MAG: glutamine--fructose-6-phosphate aminotransferase [Nitrospirae bacterium GWB2_47_37]HAK89452.1 glutamine--fructose-6-phosphate transaminase (isomerizing) [Nitrospiraceae bacterium]
MCGIIGYIGNKNAIPFVMDGLKRLEYRGYDSAGIAYFSEGAIEIKRCKGKIHDLENIIGNLNLSSNIAVGHTRWATHGRPSDENAHPHRSDGIVIVHNGIIENYIELKHRLQKEGFVFASETDTEVLCHLINSKLKNQNSKLSLEDAVKATIKEIKGAYAFAVIYEKEPDKVIAVRKESPLVIGLGDGEYFLASDVPAFLSRSKEVIFLDNDEMAIIRRDGVIITDFDGAPINKNVVTVSWSPSMAEKGGYRHFMLKEIYEQPRAIADTIRGRVLPEKGEVTLEEFGLTADYIKKIDKIFITACGTSYHAGIVGKYMIEETARIPVEVDIASEFRYRDPIMKGTTLFIAITQSGETADTLAALREAKRLGAKTLSICNVIGSTASRESDFVFYTHSGPEIGVASTKAFTTQIVALYLLAIALGKERGILPDEASSSLIEELLHLPVKAEQALELDGEINAIAKELFKAKDFLFLGRGILYPIALEGALKLKEISYIHAEGYPAGEMKHGPIALIDEEVPVLILAPSGRLYEKALSNMEEAKSRGGAIIAVTSTDNASAKNLSKYSIAINKSNDYLNTVLLTIPLQLLAYHIAVLRGCDVDQPRNLAKSVTVE